MSKPCERCGNSCRLAPFEIKISALKPRTKETFKIIVCGGCVDIFTKGFLS